LRKPVGEIYPSSLIVSLARERDIPICFGSDAHSPRDVGRDFSAALGLARNAGYSHYFKIKKRKKTLAPLPKAL
jgi:histidinol-phosphatase (PHP family)